MGVPPVLFGRAIRAHPTITIKIVSYLIRAPKCAKPYLQVGGILQTRETLVDIM